MGARRPFPVPRRARSHASSERLSVRSRPEFAAGGSACCAGTVWGPGLSSGGVPPGMRAPRPGRARAAERMADGWRKPRRLSPWWFSEGRVWSSAVAGPGPRGGKGGFEVLCAWEDRPGVPGVATGPPCVSVAAGSPRCLPGGPSRSGALPRCPLSRSLCPGTFLRCCSHTLLNYCVRDPLPGGRRRRNKTPPTPVASPGSAPRAGLPAVRVSPLGPPHHLRERGGGGWWRPWAKKSALVARAVFVAGGGACLLGPRARPGGEKGGGL